MEAIKEILGVGRFASVAECVEAARALSEEAWGLQVKADNAERELAGLRDETSELFAGALERAGYSEDAVRAARGMWVENPKWAAMALLGCDVVEAARGCNQHKPGCDAADGGDKGDDGEAWYKKVRDEYESLRKKAEAKVNELQKILSDENLEWAQKNDAYNQHSDIYSSIIGLNNVFRNWDKYEPKDKAVARKDMARYLKLLKEDLSY